MIITYCGWLVRRWPAQSMADLLPCLLSEQFNRPDVVQFLVSSIPKLELIRRRDEDTYDDGD